jgi:ethanolamine transporter EutH
MDVLLIFTWFLVALAFFASLIVTSYYVYVRSERPFVIFSKLLVVLIVYGLFTSGSGFLAGLTLFIGAHSNPPGAILSPWEIIFSGIFIFLYAAVGWLMCSFLVGHILLPVPERTVKDRS